MRVLIVEDEASVREIFREFVVELGHEPVLVDTAERALEQLATGQPDAVLLDVRLPGMSGLEFLDHPAVRASPVPVVVISGGSSEDEARDCLRLGALDYLRKPVSLKRLGEVLELVEPYARSRRRAEAVRAEEERRPAPRARVKLTVRLVSSKGVASRATCTQLSASGMKVETSARFKTGQTLRVAFTPSDAGGPVEALALVTRRDPDGVALWFMDLLPSETRRLASFVERLLLA